MDAGEEFRKYVDGIIKELEDQIAREEATMTEEEKIADELRQRKFFERLIRLVKEKYP